MKTFYIKTFGCKVNQCDSQDLRGIFSILGCREETDPAKADVCMVNTCCVTQKAEAKSRRFIRQVNSHKHGLLAVTGCCAGYDREAIQNAGEADYVFANDKKDELRAWIENLGRREKKTQKIQEDQISEGIVSLRRAQRRSRLFKDCLPAGKAGFAKNARNGTHFFQHTRAFLKIQEGCNNCCSYCVVPFVRGPAKSRSAAEITDEVRRLVRAGHKEIVLTGVCLGSWGRDFIKPADLAGLLEKIEETPNLERIRLSSIEPGDISAKLLACMARSKKICPHLHIPFQSGDDRVLADMNKRLVLKDYRRLVSEAKEKIKNLAISCDIIVGFPTEEEECFKNTLRFLEFTQPLKTHIFPFSQRKETPAATRWPLKKLSAQTVYDRLKALKKTADEQAFRFKKEYVGKILTVLFEGKKSGFWHGCSENYIRVSVQSPSNLANVLVKVKLIAINEDRVMGKIVLTKETL